MTHSYTSLLVVLLVLTPTIFSQKFGECPADNFESEFRPCRDSSCSRDSDCPRFEVCCLVDCTGRSYFECQDPFNSPNPGFCPARVLPDPESCLFRREAPQCEHDGHCQFGSKCCVGECGFIKCLPSVDVDPDVTTETPTTVDTRECPTRRPVQMYRDYCDTDADCDANKKCCGIYPGSHATYCVYAVVNGVDMNSY